jgi:branched-chain amino acid transport system permease protein
MYAYYVTLAGSIAVFGRRVDESHSVRLRTQGHPQRRRAAEIAGPLLPVKLQAMAYGAMAAALLHGAYIWSFRYIDPRTVFGLDVALVPVAMALLSGSGLL